MKYPVYGTSVQQQRNPYAKEELMVRAIDRALGGILGFMQHSQDQKRADVRHQDLLGIQQGRLDLAGRQQTAAEAHQGRMADFQALSGTLKHPRAEPAFSAIRGESPLTEQPPPATFEGIPEAGTQELLSPLQEAATGALEQREEEQDVKAWGDISGAITTASQAVTKTGDYDGQVLGLRGQFIKMCVPYKDDPKKLSEIAMSQDAAFASLKAAQAAFQKAQDAKQSLAELRERMGRSRPQQRVQPRASDRTQIGLAERSRAAIADGDPEPIARALAAVNASRATRPGEPALTDAEDLKEWSDGQLAATTLDVTRFDAMYQKAKAAGNVDGMVKAARGHAEQQGAFFDEAAARTKAAGKIKVQNQQAKIDALQEDIDGLEKRLDRLQGYEKRKQRGRVEKELKKKERELLRLKRAAGLVAPPYRSGMDDLRELFRKAGVQQ